MKTQTVQSARKMRAAVSSSPIPTPSDTKALKPLGYVTVPVSDPLAYGMLVCGNCMAPDIVDGDTIIVSPSIDVVAGMIVAFSFQDGRQWSVKRLTYLPPPMKEGDELERLISVAMAEPPKTFFLSRSIVYQMHAVVGVVHQGTFQALNAQGAS